MASQANDQKVVNASYQHGRKTNRQRDYEGYSHKRKDQVELIL